MRLIDADAFEREVMGSDDEDLQDVIYHLRDFPTAQQWIPVSSGKLPKIRQWVLCQCRAGIQEVLRLTDDGGWECIYPNTIYMKSFVVAWMPLPEPWKGEEDE